MIPSPIERKNEPPSMEAEQLMKVQSAINSEMLRLVAKIAPPSSSVFVHPTKLVARTSMSPASENVIRRHRVSVGRSVVDRTGVLVMSGEGD
jgi:hypothetical protein